jgi:hypothetical protein
VTAANHLEIAGERQPRLRRRRWGLFA